MNLAAAAGVGGQPLEKEQQVAAEQRTAAQQADRRLIRVPLVVNWPGIWKLPFV